MSRDAGSAKESLKKLAALALLTLFYFAAGKLGLALAIVNPSASAVWPPTGIALAALLVLGYRAWPAILAGAFLVNISTSGSVPASLLIAGGNALEALAGAYLVNRYANGRQAFERARDIFRFIVLAGMVSTALSATIGVASLLLNELVQTSNAPHVWLTWWLGDATGALIVAPVLILWANYIRDRDRTRVLEAGLLLLSLLVVGVIVFSDLSLADIRSYPVYLLALPAVIWFAFRAGSPETATAILILSGIAIASTFTGGGPFSSFPANEALLLLQGCMSIVAITFLSLAAVVAERRRMEQALAYSEDKYNAVVETAHDVVVTINGRCEILYINAAAEKLFGYRVAEMIGQNLAMLMPERLRSGHRTSFERYLRTGERRMKWDGVELAGRHRDGHEIPLEISFGESSHGGLRLFTGIMRDITKRREAEESSRWLATLVESTGDAVVGKTLDGIVLSWNYGAEKIYGYTAKEMIGRPISILMPPDRIDDMPRILESIQSGVEIHQFETERIRKDGQRIFVALTISPIRDATGAIRGASTVARDITDRKRADQALLRSQSFLAQAQEIGGIGSWVSSLGPDKRLWWSRESYLIFGIAEGTAIDNDTFFGVVHPDDREPIRQAVQQAIAEQRPYTIDHRIILPDGTERWVTERADITYDDLGRPVNLVGVVQDITDRKRTEQTIQRLAFVDALTDLPNRASLFQRLKDAIDNAEAKHQALGLLLINIKDFRDINDTLGHENGDR
ncbi:MAG: PAS domain S-box protein, partial [Pseudomonadota bacterium]